MAHHPHETGFADTPIESMKDDLFNVTPYVSGLCSFIRVCKTPMTISIQGDWGSGKTSMMHMIESQLQDRVIPVWFNTWQFSQFDMGNELAFSMMYVLLKGLKCDKHTRQAIIRNMAILGKGVIKMAAATVAGGAVVQAADKAIGIGSNVVKVAAGTIAGNSAASTTDSMLGGGENDYAAQITGLKGKFEDAVNEALKKDTSKDRVVVFVDDLDRLQPSKAVELLEVLKLFLDCEKCVFILAVDYEVVTLGIRQKYGTKVDAEKGRSFFDKIIQLPFKMPVAQYDVRTYVYTLLKDQEIFANKDELDLYVNLLRTSTGFNPRSMKRVFNTFQLLNMISDGTVRDIPRELRERVLFAIICAQMKYDRFYQYLASGRIMEPEDLEALKNPAQGEELIQDFLVDSGMDKETRDKQMRQLSSFMGYFIQALQMDDDEHLSQEELDNLNQIMKNSLITSLGDESEYASDEMDREYRKINRKYAEEIARHLRNLPENDKAQSKILLPRRRGESVYRFSDVCYQYRWKNWDDCWITFECQFSRWKPTNVLVRYSLVFDRKKTADELHEKLGDNPFRFSETSEWKQISNTRVGYFYPGIRTINDNDHYALRDIAIEIRNLIERVQKQLAEGGNA